MSSIGKISENYHTIEDTTEVVNDLIIILKKNYLFKKDQERFAHFQVNKNTLEATRKNLSDFLKYVIDCHDVNKAPDYSIIPKKVLDKFRNQLDIGAPYLEKLRAIRKRLEKPPLLGEDFTLLDRIVTALDKERGSLFKTLRTARG